MVVLFTGDFGVSDSIDQIKDDGYKAGDGCFVDI